MAVKTWLPNKKAFEYSTPQGTPPLHGLFLLCGHRGAGKGVAMVSLLRHYRAHGCADLILWISPTIGSNKQFLDELCIAQHDRLDTCDNAALQTAIDAVEEEAAAWDDFQQEVKTWKQLHAAKLVEDLHPDVLAMAEGYGMLEENAREPKSRYGHRPVVHIVCDDLMGSPMMSGGPRSKLVNTCIRHRHIGNGLGCTLWLSVQSWSAQGSVPRPCRENCTGTALWYSPHEQQRTKMAEELCDRRGPELFLKCYQQAC